MPRQREIPRINSVTIIYNGDKKSFDTFMEAMINDYLNSDNMSKCSNADFIDKVCWEKLCLYGQMEDRRHESQCYLLAS